MVRRFLGRPVLAGICVVLLSLSLRPAITGIAPLTERIIADGHSQSSVGLLTMVPLICFGVCGFLAALVGNALGLGRALLVGLALLTVGIWVRGLGPAGDHWILGSFILGTGIALGNVLLPGFLKERFPRQIGLMTALYSTGINVGTMAGLAAAIPLVTQGGWNESLRFWTIPAAVALVFWVSQSSVGARGTGLSFRPFATLIKLPRVWQLSLNFAFLALVFFSSVAWLPAILQDKGLSEETAAVWVTVMQVTGCVASIIAPIVGSRRKSQSVLMATANGLIALTLFTIAFASGPPLLAAVVLLGVGLNSAFALALLALPLRSGSPSTTGYLSALAQSVGYLLSSPAPWLTGYLHELSGGWTLSLLVLTICALASGVCAFLVGRPGTVSVEVE